MTRWCCVWPPWLREREGKAPTSHYDLLVLCVATVVEGEERKGTNELQWLVGAVCDRHGWGRGIERHQRVFTTHRCCVQPLWLREKKEKAPTSLNDSLVLCVAGIVKGEGRKSTNESLWLIGAVCGQCCWGRGKEEHQQVVMTCWCWCGLCGQGRSYQWIFTTCWCWLWPAWPREGG